MDLEVDALSHDRAIVHAYRTDPLNHNRMSARAYEGILQAERQALQRADEIGVPTLLLYGEGDRIVSTKVAQQWFEALQCPKHMVGFPASYHELHHEAVRGDVLRLVREWITSRS
jgi:alpha-beta hydrolase superfamily lysophospholipase